MIHRTHSFTSFSRMHIKTKNCITRVFTHRLLYGNHDRIIASE